MCDTLLVPKARAIVVDEETAIGLFVARAQDVSGAPVTDEVSIRVIVRMLGCNRAAVLLAATRADRETPAQTLATLRALVELEPPDAQVRKELVRAEIERRAGRLAAAERLLANIAADPAGDRFAEAEALRGLGAVYRAAGRLDEALALRERALGLHESLGGRAHVAIAWGDVGASLASVGRLRDARGFHERALAVHRELGRSREEGVEWSYLGVALHRAGRFADAKRAHERAIEIHSRNGHARGEAADRMHLAYVLHQLGELVAAEAEYDVALRSFRKLGERSLEGVTLSYAGALAVEAGRPEDAGALLQQALVVHREVGSPRHEAVTRIHLAEHHRSLGETRAAIASAKRAAQQAPATQLEVEHHAWALALAGRMDEALGMARELEDEVTAQAIDVIAIAERVVAGAVSTSVGRARALEARGPLRIALGSRVRLATTWLEGALHERVDALVVAADGVRFVSDAGKVVELGRRAPLIGVMRHLIERRATAPGEPCSATALLAAGWPGERVLHEPGQLRVRNALAQLRKLGLKTAIVTRGGGWLLDPSLPLRTSL